MATVDVRKKHQWMPEEEYTPTELYKHNQQLLDNARSGRARAKRLQEALDKQLELHGNT